MVGSAAARGYGPEWRATSKAWLAAHPYCGDRLQGPSPEHSRCTRDGRRERAQLVDHIQPHRGDRQRMWSDSNWQSLCRRCHGAKTVEHDGGFGR